MKKLPGDIIIVYKCNIKHNHIMYGSWDIEHSRDNFFVILDHLLHFYPPNTSKKSKFWKIKKTHGYIILHMCTINDSLRVYGSWDMECNGNIFFCHLLHFYSPPPKTTRKSKRWKNKKIPRDIIILHMRTISDSHMMYSSCQGVTIKTIKILLNMEILSGDIIIFYTSAT